MRSFTALLVLVVMCGCASGNLYKRGEYTDTICKKRLFKKEVCEDVTKKGVHLIKRITVRGIGAKFDFKEDKGDGATFVPDFSGLSLKNQ